MTAHGSLSISELANSGFRVRSESGSVRPGRSAVGFAIYVARRVGGNEQP